MKPAIGEKVTLMRSVSGFLAHGIVSESLSLFPSDPRHFWIRERDERLGMFWRSVETEGLLWCRGWTGEAVEALKAAGMLTREAPKSSLLERQKSFYAELLADAVIR